MRYNNYHKHTHYSNILTIDCVVKPKDYIKRAIELGHTTISTVEHGFFGNIFEYYELCKKNNLKLIFGVEFYYVNDRFESDNLNSHLIILAKTNKGKDEITRLVSESSKTGFYYKPRIDKSLLMQLNKEDVLITTACSGSYIGKSDDNKSILNDFLVPIKDKFEGSFFLEIQPHVHPSQIKYNSLIKKISKKMNIPMIHANDSHYILEEDSYWRTKFLNGKNMYYEDEDGFILDYPDYETICERYSNQGVFDKEDYQKAIDNTLLLDDFEEIVMDKESIKMPSIYPELDHKGKIKKLKSIIKNKWNEEKDKIPFEQHQRYKDAIKFEMDIIEGTKMEDYFLLNYEIIKKAKENGGVATKTGRGSAVSFYINKLLDFTNIDRLSTPVTLYPTRFMSKSRILESGSLPDIDLNTSNAKPFIESSKEILGDDSVYQMVAYGRMQKSEAFRNYCRALNLPMEEYNDVAKNIDNYTNHAKWGKIIEESSTFIDVIDSISPHPCASLVYSGKISDDVGIIRTGKKNDITYCALIDSDTSDSWKYLKNDFLTVTVWEIINRTFKMLGKKTPDIDELNSMLDDKVWKLFEDGITTTLNQVGTDSAKPQIMQYKPKSVRELTAWVSAIRPSFESMKEIFLNRKPFKYDIKEFDDILQESDNFILYQENIMAVLVYSGFAEDETYSLLKAIAKKKEGIIEPIYQRFIDGFVKRTGSEEKAERVWKIIEDAVGYGFNASHALSVAYDCLYGAYLKANYPLEYYSVVLNVYEDDYKTTKKIMEELPYFNIKINNIKFGKSSDKYEPDLETNSIYKSISSIKNISHTVCDEINRLWNIVKDKEKNFPYLLDVMKNEKIKIDSLQLSILIKLNFFSEYGNIKKLLDFVSYHSMLYGSKIFKKDKVEKQIEMYPLITHELLSENSSQTEKTYKELNVSNIIQEIWNKLPNDGIALTQQLEAEMEYLGYIKTILNEDKFVKVFYITNIDTKYTPRLNLYHLYNGENHVCKISKQMYSDSVAKICKGGIIKIYQTCRKNRKKLIDGKWQELEETEIWINKFAMVDEYMNEIKLKL